jgi:hypothetical protein
MMLADWRSDGTRNPATGSRADADTLEVVGVRHGGELHDADREGCVAGRLQGGGNRPFGLLPRRRRERIIRSSLASRFWPPSVRLARSFC